MTPEQNAKAPRRQRLVINFDQRERDRPAPHRRKPRWIKVLTILGITAVALMVLVAAGLFFWWRHYQTTPAYSLALLMNAAERNDMAGVDQIVDMDQIVNNLAGPAAEKAAARYGPTLTATMRRRVTALVTVLLPRVKQSIRAELATRVQEIQSEPKPFIVVALSLPYLVNIATDGDSARITTMVQDRPVELTMRRSDARWKVSAIKDERLQQRVVDELIKDLPAIKQLQ
ncbi:MAG: hypothetical protein ACR2G5_13975 [Pyrinomonadaceae bacterium]